MAKYCPNCGNPLEDDSIFCDNCGAKVNVQQNPQPQQPYAQPQQPYAQPQQPYAQPQQPYAQPQQQYGSYPPPAQPYAVYPQPGMTPLPTPQAPVRPPKKKTGLIVGLILGGLLLAAAAFVILFLLPSIHPRDGASTAPTTTVTAQPTERATEPKATAPTTLAPTQAQTELPTQAPTEAPTEPPTTEAPVETQKQPSAGLPFADTLGKIAPTDFAWIADAQSGGLQGSFLSNEELLGKWKGEMIFNGTWELIYLTIDTDGTVYAESVKYNNGDGWIDTEEESKYFNYTCEFDLNRVYGPGDLGNIDLYQFISSNGVQYGLGKIEVSGIHVDVYLVRP